MKTIHLTLATALGMTTGLPPLLAAPQAAGKSTIDKSHAIDKLPTRRSVDTKPLTGDQKILHVLNRLGYGPRPGDVARVKQIGLKNYIEQQLNPEKIADTTVETKTARFDLLKVSGKDVTEMERNVQMSNGRLVRLQSQMAQRGAMQGSEAIQGAISAAQTGTETQPGEQRQRGLAIYRNATLEERKQLDEDNIARQKVNQAGTELVLNKVMRAAESEKQLYEVMVDFWSNHFNIDATKTRSAKVVDEQQVIRPNAMGTFSALLNASATSAAMMIYLDNAQSVAAKTGEQRPVAPPGPSVTLEMIRARAERGIPQAQQNLARIKEQAKMQGVTEEEVFKRIQQYQKSGQQNQNQGLNENYARELLELHTLGVDGGYTQKDVTEVARCLTGWGVRGGRYGGEFEFHPRLHDNGEKIVLGKVIPAGGGMEDGKAVLAILANHPATIRFVSTKLCRRFVMDDPPKSLVDKCEETWKRTNGDIKAILETIFNSSEFFSRTAYKAKIKSPFEFVVSAVRATGGMILAQPPVQGPTLGARPMGNGNNVFAPNGNGQVNPRLLSGQIGTLGQPLFNFGFPTGYPEESSKWVSAGALIGRINFALSLVNGRIIDVDMSKAITVDNTLDGKALTTQIDTVAQSILGSSLAPATRTILLKQLQADNEGSPSAVADSRRIASLLLGSPDFQRK